MSAAQQSPGKPYLSSDRVIVLALVISCHLALWMLLLRPATSRQYAAPFARSTSPALELRLIPAPHRPSQRPPSPIRHPIAPPVLDHTTKSARSLKPHAVEQADDADRQTRGTRLPQQALITNIPAPVAHSGNSRDGGFLRRLDEAQRSYAVHGVPGSDTTYAPDIHLVDPMKQGIGAVMRTTQRAFGITNSHCVDVGVWRHLTPRALSARHISLRDVDRVDEKYRCNDPPGLHF